jgi:hypothetical protein
VLYDGLGLSESIPASTQLKALKEQIDGFEVSVVRDVVAAYQAR